MCPAECHMDSLLLYASILLASCSWTYFAMLTSLLSQPSALKMILSTRSRIVRPSSIPELWKRGIAMLIKADSRSRFSRQMAVSTEYRGSKSRCARPWTCRKGTSSRLITSLPVRILAVSTLMTIFLTRKFARRLGKPAPSNAALEVPQRRKCPMTFKNSSMVGQLVEPASKDARSSSLQQWIRLISRLSST